MISGEKVGLRAVEFTDLNQLLEWRNKPEFRQYFRETRELSSEQQQEWFYDKCNNNQNTRMFSIVRVEDSKLLGACGLCSVDWVNRSAELSIYIGHEDKYIDDEYAPDVVCTLLDHAFDDLALYRLWAEVYDFDHQKQALFKSLKFDRDAIHKHTKWHAGHWHHSIYFSIISKR